jgi:hypothetical protein
LRSGSSPAASCRRFATRDAALVQAHLEQVEVETAIRRDDDLAIDDASVG